jgi:hypothetical protein
VQNRPLSHDRAGRYNTIRAGTLLDGVSGLQLPTLILRLPGPNPTAKVRPSSTPKWA